MQSSEFYNKKSKNIIRWV
ncbi:unnamed protein product [Acanthoscelides obtectus]|uniref:Uncharacterized protein n=1 Tax=Acanthoscelides obtectus TaxID=200917 RepID=A0A9P0LAW5_ACAOB|nr:unnamed protein product [Acanthoscelides obtectus]CAK1656778.1 hypothetical protein AOBTE_LOCUS19908 [Acanthoscelides obtectus]